MYAIKMGATEVDLLWFASMQVDIVDIYVHTYIYKRSQLLAFDVKLNYNYFNSRNQWWLVGME